MANTDKAPTNDGGGNVRVKDMDKESLGYYNTLSDNVKGFIDEYNKMTGKVFKITSGRRQKKNENDKTSKHHSGDAVDISADHTDDFEFLMNTKEGLGLLSKYNLGIIDETDPEELKRTKGSGAHFHIGTDQAYAKKAMERVKQLEEGTAKKVTSYKKWVDQGNDPKEFKNYYFGGTHGDILEHGHFHGDGHDHSEDEYQNNSTEELQNIINANYKVPIVTHEKPDLGTETDYERIFAKAQKEQEDQDLAFLKQEQDRVNEELKEANAFVEAFKASQTVNSDPLKEIEANNPTNNQRRQGFSFNNVDLQGYNPNLYIYSTQ